MNNKDRNYLHITLITYSDPTVSEGLWVIISNDHYD